MMPFTKQHSAYAWVVTCILFLMNLTFHNLPLHSAYKIHQPFTDYFLRLPYSELLEKRLFRSRANRRLVPIPFLQRVRSAVFFQFPFSFAVPFQFPSQFPSRIPYVFPRKVHCRLFVKKKQNVFFLKKRKKYATHFNWEGNWKGTGRELGKRKGTGKTQHFVHAEEKELEKHSIFDHTRESIFNHTRERELEKHGIFNHTRVRELEKHSIFNHAQEREQQQQQQQQQQPPQPTTTNNNQQQPTTTNNNNQQQQQQPTTTRRRRRTTTRTRTRTRTETSR